MTRRVPPPLSWFRRLRYAVETVAVYLIYGFFRLLPLKAASALGGCLMRSVGPFMGISRVARQNLEASFPEKSALEREKIVKGMWENLGRTVGEYPHLRRIWDRIEVTAPHYIEAKDSGKAAIFFSGHLANWEIAGVCAKRMGLEMHTVYRKPNNPWVDGLLRYARTPCTSGHIRKGRSGAREILSVLKRDKALGMLVDQKLNEGVPVPFFGRDAMTADAIAQFALRLGCPVYPVRLERLEGGSLRLTTLPPLAVKRTDDHAADVKSLLVQVNGLLESWIRERPEQWLWIHRRW